LATQGRQCDVEVRRITAERRRERLRRTWPQSPDLVPRCVDDRLVSRILRIRAVTDGCAMHVTVTEVRL